MRRNLILFILFLIFLSGIGFIFYYQRTSETISHWELINENSIFVIEINNSSPEILNSNSLKYLVYTPVNVLYDSILPHHLLDTISSALLAIHQISKEQIDWVYFRTVSNKEIITKHFEESKNNKRNFEGLVIYEKKVSENISIATTIIDRILVISGTSLLVEDAIRIYSSGQTSLIGPAHSKLFKLVDSNEGTLFINLNSIKKFIESITIDTNNKGMELNGSILTNLNISEGRISMNGYSAELNDSLSLLSLLSGQKPVSFGIRDVIPLQSAAVLLYGITDFKKWNNQKAPLLIRENDLLFDVDKFLQYLKNEIAVVYLNQNDQPAPVLLFRSSNIGEQIIQLEKFADQVSSQEGDSTYQEYYLDSKIGLIQKKRILNSIFKPLFRTDEVFYFTSVRDYMLISHDVELLKVVLDNIDQEETWGRSLDWNKFLQTTLPETSIGLYYDVGNAIPILNNVLTPKWKGILDSLSLHQNDKGAIQFSHLDDYYFFSFNHSFESRRVGKSTTGFAKSLIFEKELISRPISVKNHLNGQTELIVQDIQHNLHLMTLNGNVEWKVNVGSSLKGDISQIDFYKNRKLQIVFATENKIHVIDRLGRYVDGFPKQVTTSGIEFLEIVDYDKSKNYRFLIADKTGNLFLMNKQGTILEGWSPNAVKQKLFASARHYRILGKDYFVAIQKDGVVYLFNRKGEPLKNFPLKLNIEPAGDFYLERSNSFSDNLFNVVSSEGLLIKFDLLGRINMKDVLSKNSTSSKFSLVVAESKKEYVVCRSDQKDIAFFNPKGKVIFESPHSGSGFFEFAFDDKIVGEPIYAIIDKSQDFIYVYDKVGKRLHKGPIEGAFGPYLLRNKSSKGIDLYSVFNNSINITELGN